MAAGSAILINLDDHKDEMEELKTILQQNEADMAIKNEEFSLNKIESVESTLDSTQNAEPYINSINSGEQKEDEIENLNKEATVLSSGENEIIDNFEKEEPFIEDEKIKEMVTNLNVTGIGDSVLLSAANELSKVFPNGYFDGKVSRTILGGEDVIKDLMEQGKLSDILILALANNGDYYNSRNKHLMELIGDREVYWVTAVLADIPEFNEKFAEFAKDYPNIHIVDWEKISKGHDEYFYADGIHLKNAGAKAYAQTIYEAIYKDMASKNDF